MTELNKEVALDLLELPFINKSEVARQLYFGEHSEQVVKRFHIKLTEKSRNKFNTDELEGILRVFEQFKQDIESVLENKVSL